MAPQRTLADLDPRDIAAALESLFPGSGAAIARDGDRLVMSWQRPEPVPDEATIRTAVAALPAKRAAQEAKIAARRQRLRQLAQGAVGKDVATLNTPERLALLSLVFEHLGVLDDDGNVRPLEQWS